MTKKARKYTRAAASRALDAFMQRVAEYNAGDYPYTIIQVALFGSYVKGADRVGDVDLAFRVEPRVDVDDAMMVEARKRAPDSVYGIARLLWPLTELHRHLKGRSPVLSLHESDHIDLALVSGGALIVDNGAVTSAFEEIPR